ncbi:MAG: hypothetical protein ACRD5G_08620 [Candidatus Acidiferrales bacterium]
MRRVAFALLIVFLAAGAAEAQSSPPADQSAAIQLLLERIEKLEKRVQELEGHRAVARAEPTAEAAAPIIAPAAMRIEPRPEARPKVSLPQMDHAQHEAALPQQIAASEEVFPNLEFRGFANADFSATNQSGTTSGFNLGQFVLHLTSPLSRKISVIGEISFSARPTGFVTEIERSVIRYDYNDYFKLSFGRYHTPINYWNTAYHHGLWLQTTVSRPEMTQFGGNFIPVHFVGLLAEGSIPSGGAGLNYNVGLGNGRGEIISRGGDAGDNNNNRAWLVNIFSRPTRLYGLQIGASVYGDKISTPLTPGVRELITSAHVVWTKERPEFIAEFANIRHKEIPTGRVVNSQAFYVQTGYRLPWQQHKWKPYYRFEYIHVPISEPVLNFPSFVGSTLGVRYDISELAALKGEWRFFRRQPGTPHISGVFLQTSFTF